MARRFPAADLARLQFCDLGRDWLLHSVTTDLLLIWTESPASLTSGTGCMTLVSQKGVWLWVLFKRISRIRISIVTSPLSCNSRGSADGLAPVVQVSYGIHLSYQSPPARAWVLYFHHEQRTLISGLTVGIFSIFYGI